MVVPRHALQGIKHPAIWCRFTVNPVRIGNNATRERARLAEAKGIEFDDCGLPVEIAIDGRGYCRRHAGEVLLRAALDENAGS